MIKAHTRLDLAKDLFRNRIINPWNNLLDAAVHANKVKQFEVQLDQFGERQEIKWDYKTELKFIIAR